MWWFFILLHAKMLISKDVMILRPCKQKDFCYFGTNLLITIGAIDNYQHGIGRLHSWTTSPNSKFEGCDGGNVNITQ
jgi:hypothetical protein